MSRNHRFLFLFFPIIYIYERLKELIFPRFKNQVRVLLYHDVSLEKFEQFKFQITNLKKKWNFITPEEFTNHINGTKPLKGKNLLLTFDDGFISNKFVAAQILNPLQIKAIFFVVPNFVSISSSNIARHYVSKYIYPSINFEDVPMQWTNMNWDDLSELINAGHTIGCHTMSHNMLSKISSNKMLYTEIVESAEILQNRLKTSIDHFAFPFGNIKSYSIEAHKIAKKRFNYIYSGLRGVNDSKMTGYVIRRDSITPSDHPNLISCFLSGAVDYRYKYYRKILDGWIN